MNSRTYSAIRLRNAALPLLALVAALTVSRHAGWGQNQATAAPGTLEGTWIGTLTPGPGGPPPFQALHTFTSNGGFISTSAAAPGAQQGTWVQTGDRTFNFTGGFFSFDSKGRLTGSQKESEVITVNGTFDAYSGTAKDDFFDAAGKLMFTTGTATVQGTRLRAEPLQ